MDQPDGDLILLLREGVYGRADYPYLTYNDLFTMQKDALLAMGREHGAPCPDESKLRWMTQQGITGILNNFEKTEKDIDKSAGSWYTNEAHYGSAVNTRQK